MNKIKYIMIATAILALVSCKKDDYLYYDQPAKIQFGPAPAFIYQPSFTLADTFKTSTFYYDAPAIVQDTTYFDIYVLGGKTNTDRTFTLQQEQLTTAGITNAVPGTHYLPFTDPAVSKYYVIKADSVHAQIPIITLRDISLKTNAVILKFNVAADANFLAGQPENIWRKLQITDRLSKPTAWSTTIDNTYFGVYSMAKHAFMIQNTGEKWDQPFMATLVVQAGPLFYYKALFKAALATYNNANPSNPLKDENGVLITFPN